MRLARGMSAVIAAALCVALVPSCASGSENAEPSTAPSSSSAPSGSAADPASSSASASPSPSSSTAARGRYALFFGDSNFVGGGCTPDPQQDMARIAGDRLGYRSVIRGAGGTGFATGNATFGLQSFLGQVRAGALEMTPAPQLVVIEGGSNDGGRLQPAARNAVKVLRAAQARYPGALVVLVGPIDVRAGHGDVVPQIVPRLQRAASRVGAPFLDAYDWLPWQTTPGLVCSDFDHASLAGQQVLGATLADQLSQAGA